MTTNEAIERARKNLMSRVTNDLITGCWLISGWTDPSGYGRMRINGKQYTTHRASWIIHNGPILDDRHVLHHCDIPHCVNPKHLYLGTNDDNVRDRILRTGKTGGAFRGERNQINRLKEHQVLEIRNLYNSGVRICDLVRQFQVSKGCIEGVCYGINWSWL